MVSRDLGFVSRDQCTKHLNEIAQIARMLHGLRSKVEKGTSLGKRP